MVNFGAQLSLIPYECIITVKRFGYEAMENVDSCLGVPIRDGDER